VRSAKRRDCPAERPRCVHASRGRRSAWPPTPVCLPPRRRAQGALPRHWCCQPCRREPADTPRGASAEEGSSGKEGRSRGFGTRENRSRQRKKKHCDDRCNEDYAFELSANRAIEDGCRLIEIHDLDDPQIIKSRDYAGQDADHRKPRELSINRGKKDI